MVNYIASKATLLKEILRIDSEIKELRTDSTFLKIRRNLKKLENTDFRTPIIITVSPDDLDKKLRIRRRSKEMKDTILRYRERRLEFDEKITTLYGRRKILEDQLFR